MFKGKAGLSQRAVLLTQSPKGCSLASSSCSSGKTWVFPAVKEQALLPLLPQRKVHLLSSLANL